MFLQQQFDILPEHTVMRMQLHPVLITAILGFTFGITTPAHAAAGDACALLTTAQVAAALGVQVDPGALRIPNHREFCIWREHGKEEAAARNVQVSLLTAQQYNIGKTPVSGIPKTPESGLGDEAYFTKTPGVGPILSVKKGAAYFRVQVRPIPGFSHSKGTEAEEKALDDKYKAVERTIAHDILQKL